MPTTYNDPIMLDSTGQDIVDKLDSIASLMGDGVIDDTSTVATDKTWSINKISEVDNKLQNGVIANTKLIKDTVGWSGKNKLPKPNAASRTENGITYTYYPADQSFKVSTGGSASTGNHGMNFLNRASKMKIPAGQYIISKGTSNPDIELYANAFNGDSTVRQLIDLTAENGTLTIDYADYEFVEVGLYVRSGKTIPDTMVYPMLRPADILDSTYEPYFGSTAFPRSEQAVLGAKNLLPLNANNIQIPTGDSVTVEDKGLNGFKISGSKTSGHWTDVIFITDFVLKANVAYKLSCIGIPSNVKGIRLNDGSSFIYSMDNGVTSVIYTPSTDISVKKVYTTIAVSDAGNIDFTYFPMITLASDNDDTYALHAMTNRELTEKVASRVIFKTLSGGDLDDILTTGWYSWGGTAPAHSPQGVAYSCMQCIVETGVQKQIVYFGADVIYMRQRSGSPATWGSWYKFQGTVVS